jgi:hypothetical protein
MTRAEVQAWLDRYVAAWRANDPQLIADLFAADAIYRWRPYGPEDRSARGRQAIVAAWLDDPDDPDAWEAAYAPFAVDGDRAVATGVSRYFRTAVEPERTYHNVFLLHFADDGRCSEFTELWMLEENA